MSVKNVANIAELIEALREMPQDGLAFVIYDGDSTIGINRVWLSRTGKVMLGEQLDPISDKDDQPPGATADDDTGPWFIP